LSFFDSSRFVLFVAQSELTFNYTEIPASQAVDAGVIREEWLDAQRSKLGKMFSKYYECQWIVEGGKVIPDYQLEDIKILGSQLKYPNSGFEEGVARKVLF
jgi:hypothetical protein